MCVCVCVCVCVYVNMGICLTICTYVVHICISISMRLFQRHKTNTMAAKSWNIRKIATPIKKDHLTQLFVYRLKGNV